MAVIVGLDCKLWRNTGNYASPTWNEVTIVKDLRMGLEIGSADGSHRASTWRQFLTTLKDPTLEFNVVADKAVDDYITLRDAAINRTVLDLSIADGAMNTNTTTYFRADWYLTGWSRGEPLEEVVTVDATAKLAVSSNAPAYTNVP